MSGRTLVVACILSGLIAGLAVWLFLETGPEQPDERIRERVRNGAGRHR